MIERTTEVTASVAAPQILASRERVVRMIQTGRLTGRLDPEDGWVASAAAVEKMRDSLTASPA